MQVKSCGISDIGRKRQRNEDSFLVNDDLRLYVVADGMGGHAGGEFASKIAVSTVETIVKGQDRLDSSVPENAYYDAPLEQTDFAKQEKLRDAITRAGNMIAQKANEEPKLRGMGTTATVMFFMNEKAYIAHVGDSRAYCIREGEILQMTEDHSLVHEQLKSGLITKNEAKSHQLKNIITRSVGVQEEVDCDSIVWKTQNNDVYLMCSDGLSNMVDDSEMQDIVSQNDVDEAARKLIELANSRGGDDNITVILVKVV